MGALVKDQLVEVELQSGVWFKCTIESIHGPHVTEVTDAFVDLVGASAFDRPTLARLRNCACTTN